MQAAYAPSVPRKDSVKKVLVITYYWPPAGGSGVQRVAKFCKYLGAFGWEPLVLTVRDGNYTGLDKSLLHDVEHIQTVYRAPSWEPHAVFNRLTAIRKKSANRGAAPSTTSSGGLMQTIGEYIRLNLFIPDSRIGWKPQAIRMGSALIRDARPDIIFSSAPPYTPHLIARDLKRMHGIPWVADFRDPWLENHAYNRVPRLPWVKQYNRRLEQGVLQEADCITCANPRFAGNPTKQTARGEARKGGCHNQWVRC